MTEPKEPTPHGAAYLFFFTNTPLLLTVVVLWNVWWLLYCYMTREWHWFMRSGAVTIVLGAIISFRNVLRLSREERIRLRNLTVVETYSVSEKQDQERDSVAVILGVWAMVFGTAAGAYGDLLGKFL
jgi:uncharacterized membrane protein YcjF (UPF0283 family)